MRSNALSRWAHKLVIVSTLAVLSGVALGEGSDEPIPVGESFTFQGRLHESGLPVNGTYDFLFRLKDTGEGSIYSTSTQNDITVSDGLFTVELDYGSIFESGMQYELLIEVKADADSTYTDMGSMDITSIPYANHAKAADKLNYGGTVANPVITGGSINNTIIGASIPRQATFTNVDVTYLDITPSASAAFDSQLGIYHGADYGGTINVAKMGTGPGVDVTLMANCEMVDGTHTYINSTTAASSWITEMNTATPSSDTDLFADAFQVSRLPPSTGNPSSSNSQMLLTRYGSLALFPAHDLPTSSPLYPPAYSYGAQFYVGNNSTNPGAHDIYGEMYAMDSSGNKSRLTSHASPTLVDEKAVTSFTDENCTIPYSFHHEVPSLGKGCVVDVSKALMWVQEKMQAESGEEGGKVFFYYDLSEERTESSEQYLTRVVDQAIEKKMSEAQWIEVPMAGNQLPREAWEEVELVIAAEVEEEITEMVVDWDTMEVTEKQRSRPGVSLQRTGETRRRLKENYRLYNGKVLRKPTVDEITIEPADIPSLPQWVLDRMPENKTAAIQILMDTEIAKGKERVKDRELAELNSSEPKFMIQEEKGLELASAQLLTANQ
jgi:hypothetical protein